MYASLLIKHDRAARFERVDCLLNLKPCAPNKNISKYIAFS